MSKLTNGMFHRLLIKNIKIIRLTKKKYLFLILSNTGVRGSRVRRRGAERARFRLVSRVDCVDIVGYGHIG